MARGHRRRLLAACALACAFGSAPAQTSNLALNPGLYPNLPYDSLRDFEPVGLLVSYSYTLVARKDLPFDSLQEVLAHARGGRRQREGARRLGRGAQCHAPAGADRAGDGRRAARTGILVRPVRAREDAARGAAEAARRLREGRRRARRAGVARQERRQADALVGDDARSVVRRDVDRWSRLVKTLGIRAE